MLKKYTSSLSHKMIIYRAESFIHVFMNDFFLLAYFYTNPFLFSVLIWVIQNLSSPQHNEHEHVWKEVGLLLRSNRKYLKPYMFIKPSVIMIFFKNFDHICLQHVIECYWYRISDCMNFRPISWPNWIKMFRYVSVT